MVSCAPVALMFLLFRALDGTSCPSMGGALDAFCRSVLFDFGVLVVSSRGLCAEPAAGRGVFCELYMSLPCLLAARALDPKLTRLAAHGSQSVTSI